MSENQQRFREQDGIVRQYDYADSAVLVADVGANVDGSVDVVEETAIVVTEDEQYEFEIPEGEEARGTMNNGVVTVEVWE
ncbi:MAG: hypothetical protein PPP58_10285 [Natronomonas sp.]